MRVSCQPLMWTHGLVEGVQFGVLSRHRFAPPAHVGRLAVYYSQLQQGICTEGDKSAALRGAEAMGFANIILHLWAWIFMLWSVANISIALSSVEIPDPSCSGPQGTEFITVFMQNHLPRYGGKDFRLFITGYTPETLVTISVNKAGVRFNVRANLGETKWIQIPEFVELAGSNIFDHTVIIRADHQIAILSLNYKTYTADTTVVYPVQRLGTEYYVVTPVGNRDGLDKQFAVVAWKDPTIVEVYLKGAVTFQGENYRAGTKLVIPLGAYQAVQLQSRDDLSGTRIMSQNPVAVYSGHVCVAKHTKCDHVSEQLLPVSVWGTSFIVPPLSFQPKFDLVYVAASQHTRIDYQSEREKSRRNLVAGQVVAFEIKISNPLYISASAGIQVAFFCTGGSKGKIVYDPFFLMIPDVSGYCQTYNIHGQDRFENYAVIVAKTAETAAVTIDAEPLRVTLWRPIPGTAYSWTTYNLRSGFSNHTIENPSSPFGVLSVGITDKAGYGSAAIGGISSAAPTIQPPDLPPTSCSGPQGTEFITVFMQNHLPSYGSKDFKLFITGYIPGTFVTISVNKAEFLVTITANPEQTVSVMIPVFVELAGSNKFDHTVIIRADHEISILALNYKTYTADTTVVYPVQRLGTEYYVVTPLGKPDGLDKQFAVVAWKDPTIVEVYLKGAVTFQRKAYRAGTKLVIPLGAYQAVQLQSRDDLSGTRIVSQNPVAVYSGHVCVAKHTKCDYVSEQLLPVSGWGTTFIVPPLSFQPKFDLVYVAASQYTHIDYQSGRVRASKDLVAGQVVTFEIKFPSPLYISASAGIQVVFFCAGGSKGKIVYDPFFLMIPDVSGYCQTYNIHGQDQFENYAMITAKTSESGGITIDKEPLENIAWRPIPGTGFSWAEYNLGKGFKRETMEHPISPFGLLSIGIASKSGYGSTAIGASNIPTPSCSVGLCEQGTVCKMIDGQPECLPVSAATCWAGGYLHYHTFDGRLYDIHGTCTYTVAKTCGCECGPHSFDITAESGNRGFVQVSYIGLVTIQVDGITITVARAEVGFVRTYTADTTVVYPVEKLGTEYYVVTPMGNRDGLNKQFAVVAWKDPTIAEVYLKGAVTFQGETTEQGQNWSSHLELTRPSSCKAVMTYPALGSCPRILLLPIADTYVLQSTPNVTTAGIQVAFFCTGGSKGKIVYDPFFLMIPDVSGYCQTYNIHGQDRFENYAVIVAKTAETAAVTIDAEPLRVTLWRLFQAQHILGQHTTCEVGLANHTIDNPSSPFGVLSVGITDKAGYGSAAIGSISSAAPTIQPPDLPPTSCSGPQGTEFITVFMQNHLPRYGSKDFKLFITGYIPGTFVTISVNKAEFLVTITANPEQTVSVMIPVFVELAGSNKFDHTVIIRADHEISILALNYKTYTADTTVVYPVQRLGTEYYVVTPLGKPDGLNKQFAVVAWKDPTIVEVYLKGAVTFQGETYRAGTKLVIPLGAYQAVQLQSRDDLSGTRIVSQNPVAVYSGHVCVAKHTKCDYVSEQLLPVSGWGTTFIVPPLSFQPKFDLVYVAASQYTHIDYQSGRARASKDLVAGQVVTFEIKFPSPLYISASAGIQVVFFCAGGSKGKIVYDPFFLMIPDVSGYCQTYNIHGQDRFENYAMITAKTSESGGITIDKEPLENIAWRPIPGTGFSWAEYNLGKGFKRETMEHPISPFGLLSIGIASKSGYGSPAIGASNIPTPSCSVGLCEQGTVCKMTDGQPECLPVSAATCWAGGYLHYHTFDGRLYDIHGTCTYTVAKTCGCECGPHSFDITAESGNRGNMQVSYIGLVTIQVDGITITVARAEVGFVRVNNTRAHLPISLNNGALRLYQSGTSLVLRTDFNLRVSYDWNNHLRVTVPNDFSNSLCGLCGNYNGDPSDDFWTPAEDPDPSDILQEQSWAVEDEDQFCWHDCIGGCRPCAASIARKYKEEASCGLITKVSDGPFSQCHSKVDPTVYLDNCVYDLCHNDGYRKALCEALKAYADACQLEGVRIGEWRQLARCPMECPLENSQYQLCGTACPATCVDQSAPSSCQDPCVESCQCKDGFVLSQGKCIPKGGCGCLFEGRPFAPNESFWVDEACGTRCKCNAATRQVECAAAKCKHSERCGLVNGVQGCYPSSYATCSVAQNLHYATFDGQRYDFQGTCRYQLTALCKKAEGLVDFEVYFQENSTTPVQIKVYETDIRVSNQLPGKVMVNGFLINLPFNLDKKITMYRKGWATVIQTDFGLSITYAGWSGRTTVTLPVAYAGAVCGLCGNFNMDRKDDMLMRDGTLAPSPISFGQSWKVGDLPGCSAVTIPPCASVEAIEKQQRGSRGQCGLILHKSGPFRGCHSKVDPHGYFVDCVYGYCVLSGRESNVCQAVAGYSEACQEAGAMVHPWRTTKFCSPSCPPNSHYEFCSSSCDLTCSNLYAPVQCTTQCKEGCVCDEGFVLSGDSCVPISQCGCLHRGFYYQAGETFHPSGSCEEQCVCLAGGEVVCKAFSCGTGEQCRVVDGIQKCHPFGSATCSASGHPHYLSFDGVPFDFQGTCTYILAKTCTDASHLTPFTISVEKEDWGSGNVSMATLVSIQVYGITLTLLQNKQGLIMVDGVFHNLPVITANRRLQAYQHGTNILVQTDFGLIVSYDLVYQARVTVPQRYQGHTCGLCGNYSGRQDSKFLLPNGRTASDVAAFGSAWEVQVPGASCADRCAGNSCPVCEERKKDVFKQHHYCGLLTAHDGPFTACHGTVSPSVYLSNCLYDVCLGNGDSQVLCQSIHSYVTACQEAKVTIPPWRSPSFCPVSCPANSHYAVCADLCTVTCAGNIIDCPETCAEGCQCDDGFFFDGQGCVTQERCGCFEQGRYYEPSEVVLMNDCQQSCTCIPTRGVTCEAHSCSIGKTCQIRGGVMDCISQVIPKPSCSVVRCREGTICKMINGQAECVPVSQATCWAGGYLHYHTFDGWVYDFHGTCNYTVAKTCRDDSVLPSFHVMAESENSGNTQAFYIGSVTVQVDGVTVTAARTEVGFVWLNNTRAHLPISLNNAALRLYQSGTSLVLRTDFNLRVSYDWNNHLRVTVPNDFSDSLCGLCGNYNRDPSDDFQTSEGDRARSVATLGKSWAVEDEDQFCWHDCIGGCRPCAASIARKYKEEASCGLITKVSDGPFSQCHSKVDPTVYLDNCVYDLCHNDGYRRALCEALKAYADACQLEGVRIGEWRQLARCREYRFVCQGLWSAG
ncbi:unnamed protein product [Caretta caretta]